MIVKRLLRGHGRISHFLDELALSWSKDDVKIETKNSGSSVGIAGRCRGYDLYSDQYSRRHADTLVDPASTKRLSNNAFDSSFILINIKPDSRSAVIPGAGQERQRADRRPRVAALATDRW
mgnify:CR=1 FL=1